MRALRTPSDPYPTPASPTSVICRRRVLKSLFPSWLPARFAVMFSKPFPAFSSRMNAWVTLIASQWLMGPSQLNDVEVKTPKKTCTKKGTKATTTKEKYNEQLL